MGENNNVMTTITKNPLVIIGIVVIVGIVLVLTMRGSEEAFSTNNKIVENYPQSTPMNVMYSDASGNLGTTSDLGLQNLTVSGDSTFANDNVIINSGDISGPGKQTRINSQGIIFGGTNNGRQGDSAQISAGKHDGDALCIMGMSNTGGDWKTRRIRMWAEGGTTHEGELTARLSVGPGQFRAVHGDYGTIFRQDGSDFHILTTKKGDPMGSLSDLRPLYINNASGDVTMSQKLTAGSISTGALATPSISLSGNDLQSTLNNLQSTLNNLQSQITQNNSALTSRLTDLEQNVTYRKNFAPSCNGNECNQKGTICSPGSPGAGSSTWICDGTNWKPVASYGNYGT
jgi:hypothetical protein